MIKKIKNFINTTNLIPTPLKKSIRSTYIKLSKKIKPMNVIIFYPSFTCNYRCPYCILITKNKFYDKFPKVDEHNYDEWLEVFKKLPRSRICFSEGEPLLFKGIYNFLNKLISFHEVNLTTNLSQPIDNLKKINKKIIITASFHPHMAKLDEFIKKVLILKKEGFHIGVEFVAYPESIPNIPQIKKKFNKEGVSFWIDPFIDPDHKYNKKEKEILSKYLLNKRQLGFNFKDFSKKECCAGSKYQVILPNGEVYTCHEGMYYLNSNDFAKKLNKKAVREQFYLGNLFNNTFKMREKKMICCYPCSEACDIDNAEVKKIS